MNATDFAPQQSTANAMSKPYKILVVDDEVDIIDLLKYNLEKEGYEVISCSNGREAINACKGNTFDLILLDIMMPITDGIEACRQIRSMVKYKETYILFLTARTEEYSEIAAFEAGANDFISKPIKPRALSSRIASYFSRRSQKDRNETVIQLKDLVIDRSSFTVTKSGNRIVFPKKEFELLYFLCQNPNKVFSRDDLLKYIWGEETFVVSRTIDVHIRKIREKIGDHYITTLKGIGYKCESE
ncbi:MAG TPA: response regulator transcription factor [Cytophagaceae bacterium]|jgi:two-component system alkaline phosphatase synthesis response regulator PhoP